MPEAEPTGTATGTATETQETIPAPYGVSTNHVVETSAAVVDAWLNMEYPVYNDGESGVIRTEANYVAKQHPDGSGIFQSPNGTRVYAIRTAGGTVIRNTSYGPRSPWTDARDDSADADYALPGAFLNSIIEGQTTFDGDASDFLAGVVAADVLDTDDEETGVLLNHEDGLQIYIGRDSTSHDDFALFGFTTDAADIDARVPSARDAISLLTPELVEAARAEGALIKRQGEYHFRPNAGEPEGSIQRPGVSRRPFGNSPLGSHVPSEWATAVSDDHFLQAVKNALEDEAWDPELWEPETPQDAVDLIASDVKLTNLTMADIRDLADGIYVRGSIRHRLNEHEVTVVEDWHRAESHNVEVVTDESGHDISAVTGRPARYRLD